MINLKHIRENNLCSPLCHAQNLTSVFYHICRYAVINPYGLVILIYVSGQILFCCRTHILDKKGGMSA